MLDLGFCTYPEGPSLHPNWILRLETLKTKICFAYAELDNGKMLGAVDNVSELQINESVEEEGEWISSCRRIRKYPK